MGVAEWLRRYVEVVVGNCVGSNPIPHTIVVLAASCARRIFSLQWFVNHSSADGRVVKATDSSSVSESCMGSNPIPRIMSPNSFSG